MKVLGIDPGTAACGYGVVEERDGRLAGLVHGTWRTAPSQPPELRLKEIFDGVRSLIDEHRPDVLAMEDSFIGANPRSGIAVGQARGVVLVAAALGGLRCAEHMPNRVKQSVAGNGHADKGQVQRMVTILLRLPEPPATDHASDALAVAICEALSSPLLGLMKR